MKVIIKWWKKFLAGLKSASQSCPRETKWMIPKLKTVKVKEDGTGTI
jgi:hypothetical protein